MLDKNSLNRRLLKDCSNWKMFDAESSVEFCEAILVTVLVTFIHTKWRMNCYYKIQSFCENEIPLAAVACHKRNIFVVFY